MANASDVINGLTSLIDGALGSSENAATKTRIHAIASVIGSLGDEFAPLLDKKFDVDALFTALQRVENGLTETEGGVHDLIAAIEHKKTANNTATVNSAA